MSLNTGNLEPLDIDQVMHGALMKLTQELRQRMQLRLPDTQNLDSPLIGEISSLPLNLSFQPHLGTLGLIREESEIAQEASPQSYQT